MKITIIAIVATLCLAGCSKSLFPKEISPSDMEAFSSADSEVYFRVFGQYLQKENGEFPTEFDKILITKDEDIYEIGFYRNLGVRFSLIDEPVIFTDTHSPHASANAEFEVPCIQAIKKNGSKTNQVFISKGKLIQK